MVRNALCVLSRHARAYSGTAGRILVRQPDGSLSYVNRSSLALNAGFFKPPEPSIDPAEHDPTLHLPDASTSSSSGGEPSSGGTPLLHDPDRRKRIAIAPKSANQILHGIEIPARPSAPASDDCCMSGCARCVYDLYSEDLQDYHAELVKARNKLLAIEPRIPDAQWPRELGPRQPAQTDEAMAKSDQEMDLEISDLDVSMRTFLAVERRTLPYFAD